MRSQQKTFIKSKTDKIYWVFKRFCSGNNAHGTHSGGSKCFCSCSEQLQRANLRIESLEKKLKLLADENKVKIPLILTFNTCKDLEISNFRK